MLLKIKEIETYLDNISDKNFKKRLQNKQTIYIILNLNEYLKKGVLN